MRPRYGDSRIGYFDESKRFYTEKKDGLQELTYINRWDLQPKPEDLERYKQGELVESGTHDALVKQGGEYAKMWSNYTKTTKWHIGNEVKVC